MRTLFGLSLLELVSASASCPQKVFFKYFKPEPEAADLVHSDYRHIVQEYKKEASLKNGRAWYVSADGTLGLYWCDDIWGVVEMDTIPDFTTLEIVPNETCSWQLVQLATPLSDLPKNITVTPKDKNLTCATHSLPVKWGIFDGSEFIYAGDLRLFDATGDLEPLGGTDAACTDYWDCASGQCDKDSQKCVCKDDSTIEFPEALNEVTGLPETQNCSVFATESKEGIAVTCGCDGKASYFCRKLCQTCDGEHNFWESSRCEEFFVGLGDGDGSGYLLPLILGVVGGVLLCVTVGICVAVKSSKRKQSKQPTESPVLQVGAGARRLGNSQIPSRSRTHMSRRPIE